MKINNKLFFVAIVVIIATGSYWLSTQWSKIPTQKQESSNLFYPAAIRIGDQVANMKVINIQPAVSSRVISFGKSDSNYKIIFSGKIFVRGQYRFFDTIGGGMFIDLNEESKKILPIVIFPPDHDEFQSLLVYGDKAVFKSESGQAGLFVDNFKIEQYPNEGSVYSANVVEIKEDLPK